MLDTHCFCSIVKGPDSNGVWSDESNGRLGDTHPIESPNRNSPISAEINENTD